MASNINVSVESQDINVKLGDETYNISVKDADQILTSVTSPNINTTVEDASPVNVEVTSGYAIWKWDATNDHYYLEINNTKVAIIDSSGNLIISGRVLKK